MEGLDLVEAASSSKQIDSGGSCRAGIISTTNGVVGISSTADGQTSIEIKDQSHRDNDRSVDNDRPIEIKD